MALNLNPDVTIYSNGPVSEDSAVQQALSIATASGAKVDTRKVTKLINNGPGPAKGITVEFEDGESVRLGMLLHRPATKNRGQHLIDQLGLKTREGSGEIVVDPVFAETSVKGCFGAGDTSDLVKQVALGMGSGMSFIYRCMAFTNMLFQVFGQVLWFRCNSATRRALGLWRGRRWLTARLSPSD